MITIEKVLKISPVIPNLHFHLTYSFERGITNQHFTYSTKKSLNYMRIFSNCWVLEQMIQSIQFNRPMFRVFPNSATIWVSKYRTLYYKSQKSSKSNSSAFSMVEGYSILIHDNTWHNFLFLIWLVDKRTVRSDVTHQRQKAIRKWLMLHHSTHYRIKWSITCISARYTTTPGLNNSYFRIFQSWKTATIINVWPSTRTILQSEH